VVRSKRFEVFVTAAVFVHICLLIGETDASANDDDVAPLGIVIVNRCFLVAYVIELACKAFVDKLKLLSDGWNVIDFLVVAFDVVILMLSFFPWSEEACP
jgi:hypothetical protein